jgi:hypothetical protein
VTHARSGSNPGFGRRRCTCRVGESR